MKTILYLDMDGVLSDFCGFLIDHLGVTSDKEVSLEDKIRLHIEEDLFLKLKPFPQNEILLNAVRETFGEYYILTTPMQSHLEKCKEDKLLWVMKNLNIKPKDVIFTENKSQYAQGNILIDDYRPNIESWNNAGGYAIKYKARSTNYTVHDVIDKLARSKWLLDNYGVI